MTGSELYKYLKDHIEEQGYNPVRLPFEVELELVNKYIEEYERKQNTYDLTEICPWCCDKAMCLSCEQNSEPYFYCEMCGLKVELQKILDDSKKDT